MKNKYKIDVFCQQLQDTEGNPLFMGTIYRTLRAEAIGNFNPLFCRYNAKHKRCLVRSREGDLSDPFRREPSYLSSLYIIV